MLDTKFLSVFYKIWKMQNPHFWTMKLEFQERKIESLICIDLVWFEFEEFTSIYSSRILNGK